MMNTKLDDLKARKQQIKGALEVRKNELKKLEEKIDKLKIEIMVDERNIRMLNEQIREEEK